MVWKTYSIPHDWTVGNELLRHTLGMVNEFESDRMMVAKYRPQLLIGLHIWATMESFEVLGVFGMYFC